MLLAAPKPPIAFAGSHIDRADHIRGNPDAIAALMGPAARLLRLDGLDPVMGPEGGLEWGSLAEASQDAELLFLGLDGERGCFAQVLPGIPAAGAPSWNAMNALEPQELAAYGGARARRLAFAAPLLRGLRIAHGARQGRLAALLHRLRRRAFSPRRSRHDHDRRA